MTVGDRPHLYPLARVVDRYPRHAVCSPTRTTRDLRVRPRPYDRAGRVPSQKLSRTDAGGWSQMRYQRHVEDHWLHHAKDVVEVLGRIVAEDRAEYVFLAGDEVIVPLLRDQLPKDLAKKVVGVLHIEMRASEEDVMEVAEKVLARARRESRGGTRRASAGRVARRSPCRRGPADVLRALENGQVEELWLRRFRGIRPRPPGQSRGGRFRAACVRDGREGPFRRKPRLLAEMDGVVAALRYKADSLAARQLTRRAKGRRMSKNNVHPDHYKVGGRDRQDDAASARFRRAVAGKAARSSVPTG